MKYILQCSVLILCFSPKHNLYDMKADILHESVQRNVLFSFECPPRFPLSKGIIISLYIFYYKYFIYTSVDSLIRNMVDYFRCLILH